MKFSQPWSNLSVLAAGVFLVLFAIFADEAESTVSYRVTVGLLGIGLIVFSIYIFQILDQNDINSLQTGLITLSSFTGILFIIFFVILLWFVVQLLKVGTKALENSLGVRQ